MQKTMLAARLHALHQPMTIDTIPVPKPRPNDVLVNVKACGIVPNMANVINNWPTWYPHQPLPKFPAIFGLDATGIVTEVGEAVIGVKPGARVYVSPLRSCGSCRACRQGDRSKCRYFTLNGYFSTSLDGQRIFDLYPYGGFSQYMTAPEYSLVHLPDNLIFEQAGKFGYLGTSYNALKNANAGPGQTALIDGITGTLGVASSVLALAMGVSRILGTARNKELLARVKAMAPNRIEVMELGTRSTEEWAKSLTNGDGVDFVISALGAKAPAATMMDSMRSVRRGGRVVNVGGVGEALPVNVKWLMDEQVQFIGSNWFTATQGQDMADMVRTGVLDLSYLEHKPFPLERVNEAISGSGGRDGGFTNYLVVPPPVT